MNHAVNNIGLHSNRNNKIIPVCRAKIFPAEENINSCSASFTMANYFLIYAILTSSLFP